MRFAFLVALAAFASTMITLHRVVAPYVVDHFGLAGTVAAVTILFRLAVLLDSP